MTKNSPGKPLDRVSTLTFDIFGTVLDLEGSIVPPLEEILRSCEAHASITGAES